MAASRASRGAAVVERQTADAVASGEEVFTAGVPAVATRSEG